ncbi:MAG: hypothetical protein IPJ24_01775 [bacterium]|nr:hypothetical protein [bacterium]
MFKAVGLDPRFDGAHADLARSLEALGRFDEARAECETGRQPAGDVAEAFQWLEVAISEGATGLIYLRVHPRLDPIRHDARFADLVARYGLDRI